MPQRLPVLKFTPHLVPKVWGGSQLGPLFGMTGRQGKLDEPYGEAWTVCDLDSAQSVVDGGAFAGQTLGSLVRTFGSALLGDERVPGQRFPLLTKLLDAGQNLSVQVHPRPSGQSSAAACNQYKHEAWYVLRAEPGAKVFIGLRPGVSPAEITRAAGSAAICELLHRRQVTAGDCFYLPPGVVHALGAGVLVAEVQTPSETTYRLYDWDRAASHQSVRPLQIKEALANIRYDLAEHQIVQPKGRTQANAPTPAARGRHLPTPAPTGGPSQNSERVRSAGSERLCDCPCFTLDERHVAAGSAVDSSALQPDPETIVLLTIASGSGVIEGTSDSISFGAGETLLVPAATAEFRLRASAELTLLEIRPTPVPIPPLKRSRVVAAARRAPS